MDFSKISLEGKVALVTGGSRGIGRASALALAGAGASVVISSRTQADLDKVADEIRAKGRSSLAVAAHSGKIEDSKNLVDKTMAEFGRIDILMNNSATQPYYGPMMDAEEWAWDKTMDVNLKGQFFLSTMVAKIMKQQGGGSIINISSLYGILPLDLGIYCASKAGLIMLTKCMAKEWGQYKIRVNTICPGVIKTKLSEQRWKEEEVGKEAANDCALLRLGEPDDIAGAVVFLASDFSSYITGESIIIDGGLHVGEPAFRTV